MELNVTLRPQKKKTKPSKAVLDLLKSRAKGYEKDKDFAQAAEMWKLLSEHRPSYAYGWSRLGHNLYLAGAFDDARPALERAVKLNPDARMAHLMLSALLFRHGEEQAGRSVITDFYQRVPLKAGKGVDGKTPSLLRVDGVTGVRPLTGPVPKTPYVRRRGGHFQTKHLFKDEVIPRHYLTMASSQAPNVAIPQDVGLILNTIADPDIEDEALLGLEHFLEGYNGPIINRPAAVRATTRDENHFRFKDAEDIEFPGTLRLHKDKQSAQELDKQIHKNGIQYPYIFRIAGLHKGQGLVLVRTLSDLDQFLARYPAPADIYAIQFIDVRHLDGYFHKYRMFSIDGALYPVVCHIDTEWMVHGRNRMTLMKHHPWMMHHEEAFMNDPRAHLGPSVMGKVEALAKQIDLEFFGFDFAIHEDGRVLIYELNPAMRHKYDYADTFPYMRPGLERITQAFTDMVHKHLT
ncbi:tetratricopeptide repeat protein [Magnetovibrio sp. PR-2]|uniref:tetratricopeptide repeat protein n=1 Tax=Magnetovibrio sp. PR-2 TaxID=3120356 RepID=UPI002FCE15EE